MEKIEKFTLINKDRSRIKVFEPFEDFSEPSSFIDAMIFSYGCIYKRSRRPVMKGSSGNYRRCGKEYKQLLIEGWRQSTISNYLSTN